MTTRYENDAPPLDRFDLSNLREPDDGVLYLYRSAIDGFWNIDSDEDMAMQDATGIPAGELVDRDEDAERGQICAIYVAEEPTEDMVFNTETTGEIGDCEVTISIKGDEKLSNLIYADLIGRADEIRQIVDEDVPPEETHRQMGARWESYQEGTLD